MTKKLVLIDGHALVHRAFHALPPTLSSPKGVPTNAVFGFISVLIKMLKDLKPDYIVATFDLAAPTFRHEEFAEYKAHRVKAPDELYVQIPLVKEILMAFGIPIYEKAGFEADDLIGSLAERSKEDKDIQTIIMTGDLDTLQLVDGDKVVVFTLRKGVTDTVIYDENEVFKRYGLRPEQLNDFKGLKGDPSDNIPGVPGVGEKTAAMLIQKFGNLENLYESIAAEAKNEKRKAKNKDPSEKLVQKLLENKDIAFFSKKLSTIIRDVDIDFSLEKADWLKNLNRTEVEKLFKELGLYSLIKRLDEISIFSQGQMVLPETVKTETSAGVKELKNKKDVAGAFGEIKEVGEFSFTLNNEFFDFCVKKRCFSAVWPMVMEDKDLFKTAKDIFEGDGIFKIGHDLKGLAKFLLSCRIELGRAGFDTKLAAYLLNSDRKDYSLEKIYFEEFQESVSQSIRETPIFVRALKERQSEQLKKEKLDWLFENIEVPTAKVLAEMELRGILIDSKAIAKLSKLVAVEIGSLEKKVYKLAGTEFNINSPKQLKKVLFDPPPGGLGLKGKVRKTSKGALSTAAGELEKLVDEQPQKKEKKKKNKK